ncbi:MAG: GreA/GreB family elongation factor [Candidatus Krumholzibacteriota bacterium]
MTDMAPEGPSLIKLGKLANSRDFDKLEGLWMEALGSPGYSWKELIPIAGQVGRQGAVDRAEALIDMIIVNVEEKSGSVEALNAVRKGAEQLPSGKTLVEHLKRLYLSRYPDFSELADVLDLLLGGKTPLSETVSKVDLYAHLQPGSYVIDRSFLVPGRVESVDGEKGRVTVLYQDRRAEYDPATIGKVSPRAADFFPALILYDQEKLRDLATEDAVALVKLALESQRDGKVGYRDLKGNITDLLGDKGWKTWWKDAKPALKRDPMIGMSAGSQPSFRLLRQADKYEDRLRRKFDHGKDPQAKLLQVMAYLDEISREEKNRSCEGCADEELLVHFGNGAAKVAVAVLKDNPALALAGLALHAETAARGVAVARPNPKAAGQVLARIPDKGALNGSLPEALLQRVLNYVRQTMPDTWGEIWSAVLMRAGKRLCDTITRTLIEGGQQEALAGALNQAIERPTSSPDLLCWLWRTRFTSGAAAKFIEEQELLGVTRIADAMFVLLDSSGKLYGMSLEEKHLKVLESARAALATQNNRPVLGLIDDADRREGIRLKGLIEKNAGLSPAMRTQLLGYLRSRFADIFIEITREWEDGGTIYTTEDGLRKAQDALNHIIEIEIPEVAQQIGEAAAHGDLSENAEYTAALEKRDQLASRATGMKNELEATKVINHEMSGSDFVNIGTRVSARSEETGEDEVFTFLGPYDTDVEQRILNYQAPLAMSFMGARVGDRVVFGEDGDQRVWEILSIEAAL